MEKLPTWKYLRESVGAELYSAGENEEIAKGLYGNGINELRNEIKVSSTVLVA